MDNITMGRTELEIAVRQYFEEQLIPMSTKGYVYLLETVLLSATNVTAKLSELYEMVAKKHGTTVAIIRHCIRVTFLEANELREQKGLPPIKARSFVISCSSMFMSAT